MVSILAQTFLALLAAQSPIQCLILSTMPCEECGGKLRPVNHLPSCSHYKPKNAPDAKKPVAPADDCVGSMKEKAWRHLKPLDDKTATAWPHSLSTLEDCQGPHFVYVLGVGNFDRLSSDKKRTLDVEAPMWYIGETNNLYRRMNEHRSKNGTFTLQGRPVWLHGAVQVPNLACAEAYEAQLWAHRKTPLDSHVTKYKEQLGLGFNLRGRSEADVISELHLKAIVASWMIPQPTRLASLTPTQLKATIEKFDTTFQSADNCASAVEKLKDHLDKALLDYTPAWIVLVEMFKMNSYKTFKVRMLQRFWTFKGRRKGLENVKYCRKLLAISEHLVALNRLGVTMAFAGPGSHNIPRAMMSNVGDLEGKLLRKALLKRMFAILEEVKMQKVDED
jgi:predicted GIY-YIG superfamily endonuclease